MNSSTCISSNSETGRKITANDDNFENAVFLGAWKQFSNTPEWQTREHDAFIKDWFYI